MLACNRAEYSFPASDCLHSPQKQTLARYRSECSCSWGKGCQNPAVRSLVLTDRISHSRVHAEQHLLPASLRKQDSGPASKCLDALPLFCSEASLSKIIGVGEKAVFFLYQWQLHEASLSTLTACYHHNFSFKKKDSVVSEKREMLLFGVLLKGSFCPLQAVKTT